MISTATLRWYKRAAHNSGYVCRREREFEMIDSHIEANAEITRLRTALQTMLSTLNAIDNGDLDKSIAGVMKLEGLK